MISDKKRLIPFRLWEEDIDKLKAKIVIDKTNFQRVMELMVKLYLEDNPEIMKKIKSVQKEKHARKRRYNSFDELEVAALYKKIAEVSSLSETQKILEEMDKENK